MASVPDTSPPQPPTGERIEVLRLAHEDALNERDRLRAARASFTARLGPLPASAAIVIGLAGSSIGKAGMAWVIGAVSVLMLLIFISNAYYDLPPYRVLRGRDLRESGLSSPEVGFAADQDDLCYWLEEKIKLEQRLCGSFPEKQEFTLNMKVNNLQDAVNVERCASIVVQALFAVLVFGLVLGIALREAESDIQWAVGLALLALVASSLVVCRAKYGLLSDS